MDSNVKKTRGNGTRPSRTTSPLTTLARADENDLKAVPTVDDDVAAWWAELDAQLRADGAPPTTEEIEAIDAMPTIDVSAVVSRLEERLPASSNSVTSNVLAFRSGIRNHDANEITSNDQFKSTQVTDVAITNNPAYPSIWEQQIPDLLDSRHFEFTRTSQADNMLVALVAFRRNERLEPLASALELAQEIARVEYRPEIRCLTLTGTGTERYSARWSYLGDWLRDHYFRCRYTASKVLASLHEVLRQEDRANRNWTYRQLRGTIVFTVMGAERVAGQCEDVKEWQALLHERVITHQYRDYLHRANLMMTVIDGGNIMSVAPHSVDDAVKSATIVYQSDAPPESESLASYLPMIKSALDGETASHE